MRGPWTASHGLHVVDPQLEKPGGGLSVRAINGKIDGEERGLQDGAPKATTSPGEETIGKKAAKGLKEWEWEGYCRKTWKIDETARRGQRCRAQPHLLDSSNVLEMRVFELREDI